MGLCGGRGVIRPVEEVWEWVGEILDSCESCVVAIKALLETDAPVVSSAMVSVTG